MTNVLTGLVVLIVGAFNVAHAGEVTRNVPGKPATEKAVPKWQEKSPTRHNYEFELEIKSFTGDLDWKNARAANHKILKPASCGGLLSGDGSGSFSATVMLATTKLGLSGVDGIVHVNKKDYPLRDGQEIESQTAHGYTRSAVYADGKIVLVESETNELNKYRTIIEIEVNEFLDTVESVRVRQFDLSKKPAPQVLEAKCEAVSG